MRDLFQVFIISIDAYYSRNLELSESVKETFCEERGAIKQPKNHNVAE